MHELWITVDFYVARIVYQFFVIEYIIYSPRAETTERMMRFIKLSCKGVVFVGSTSKQSTTSKIVIFGKYDRIQITEAARIKVKRMNLCHRLEVDYEQLHYCQRNGYRRQSSLILEIVSTRHVQMIFSWQRELFDLACRQAPNLASATKNWTMNFTFQQNL